MTTTWRGPSDPAVTERVTWLVQQAERHIHGTNWVTELEEEELSTISMVIGELRVHRRGSMAHAEPLLSQLEREFQAYRQAAQTIIQERLAERQIAANEKLLQSQASLKFWLQVVSTVAGVASLLVAIAAVLG